MKLSNIMIVAVAMVLPTIGALTAHGQIDQITEDLTQMEPVREAEPAPSVDKMLVGWNEARKNPDGSRIGETLRANWVQLNVNNGISGRVVGISEPINVFLLRDGFVESSAITMADGSYEMESASPGPYTLIGYSPEAIFAIGFLAVANDGTATDLPRSLVTLPVLGKDNNKLIAKLIQEHAPDVNFRKYGIYDIGEGAGDPARYFGFAGLKDLTEPAIPANTIENQPVTLGPGGTLSGRIHQIDNQAGRPTEVVNTRVIIVQDGIIIAETQVDSAGVFEITDLVPGEHGLISFGADGIAAMGIELVQAAPRPVIEGSSASLDSEIIQVSATRVQEGGQSFDGMLGSPDSTGWLNNYVTAQVYINAMNEPLPEMNQFGQMPYNYFDQGYGMGGGGGGGGYFGGGDWLLPIGIGALIYAAVDDNDNLSNPIILTSPF